MPPRRGRGSHQPVSEHITVRAFGILERHLARQDQRRHRGRGGRGRQDPPTGRPQHQNPPREESRSARREHVRNEGRRSASPVPAYETETSTRRDPTDRYNREARYPTTNQERLSTNLETIVEHTATIAAPTVNQQAKLGLEKISASMKELEKLKAKLTTSQTQVDKDGDITFSGTSKETEQEDDLGLTYSRPASPLQ